MLSGRPDLAVFLSAASQFASPASQVVLAGLLLAVISVAAIALARSRPYVLFGWLWFLGTLVPVIGFVQVGSQSMADRYTYMPLVGLFIAVVWGVCEIFGEDRRWLAGSVWALFVLVMIFCLFCTRRQVGYWKDSVTFFRRDLLVAPDNAVAYFNLGLALDSADRSSEAWNEFGVAIKADPGSALVLLGVVRHFAIRHNDAGALEYFNAALQAHPAYGDAHLNLGNFLAGQGKFADAADHFAAAIHAAPASADAYNNLGAMLMPLEKWDEAVAEYGASSRRDCSEAHVMSWA